MYAYVKRNELLACNLQNINEITAQQFTGADAKSSAVQLAPVSVLFGLQDFFLSLNLMGAPPVWDDFMGIQKS